MGKKLFITIFLLLISRIGNNIPIKGFNIAALSNFLNDKVLTFNKLPFNYNIFIGNSIVKGSILSLGIFPYISASMIIETYYALFSSNLDKEDQFKKEKIALYGKYLTLFISLLQGFILIKSIYLYPSKIFYGYNINKYGPILPNIYKNNFVILQSSLILTVGTMILTWIGDIISKKGISNGTSLLITISILSEFPKSINSLILYLKNEYIKIIFIAFLLYLIIFVMITFSSSKKNIKIQYTRKVINKKFQAINSTFLPIKLNYSGVMPIILANVFILFIQQIFHYLFIIFNANFLNIISQNITNNKIIYYSFFNLIILLVSNLWVSFFISSIQIADELKKAGGFIPGIRPGIKTSNFLNITIKKLTFIGSLILTIISIVPDLLNQFLNIPHNISNIFGGTGTIISIGVIIEVINSIKTLLLDIKYKKFLKNKDINNSYKTLN